MHEPARFVARRMAAAGQPAYRYRFSYVADSVRAKSLRGAEHASELPYMFGTLETRYGSKVTERDRALSEAFLGYVANFVKHGDPNGDNLPQWLREDPSRDAIMDFASDGAPVVRPDPLTPRLDLMERVAATQPRPLGVAELEKPDWNGFVAVGAVYAPAYPGSSEGRIIPAPISELTFRDKILASVATTGRALALGWHAYDNRVWRLSGIAGLSERREESQADALAGMEKRGLGINAGLVVVRRSGLFSQTLNLSRGINDGAGTSASLGAAVLLPFSLRSALTVGASVKVADAQQMRYDFGVNAEEAARRKTLLEGGDRRLRRGEDQAYTPEAGAQNVTINAAYVRVLAERWIVAGVGSYGYLLGPAASSPLTKQRSSITLAVGFGLKL